MHPYRSAPPPEPAPAERGLEPLPFGDLVVGVPLFVVGALGMIVGLLSPECTVEAGLGTALIILSLHTIAGELRRRRA